MNDADSPATAAEQTDPQSTAAPPAVSPERWLGRLKAAVGLKPSATIREDLADALAAEDETGVGGFSAEERAMLANILRLRDVRVDDIMVPRADIDAVEIGASLGELLGLFEKSGHSRMPVYRETLDEPVGLVHIKDLMGYVARAATGAEGVELSRVDLSKRLGDADLVRDILFVPPSMPVAALLDTMQASRVQMALVIDEYGGTDGLVSLEDAVEMVVGDIEDEHDDEEGPMIAPDGDGAFLADARADLDEVSAAVGADFAPGEEGEDIDTIGGLVISLLGRVPVRGELVALPGGLEAEILDADPRRIKRLRLYRRPAESPRPDQRRRVRPPREEPDSAA